SRWVASGPGGGFLEAGQVVLAVAGLIARPVVPRGVGDPTAKKVTYEYICWKHVLGLTNNVDTPLVDPHYVGFVHMPRVPDLHIPPVAANVHYVEALAVRHRAAPHDCSVKIVGTLYLPSGLLGFQSSRILCARSV